MAPAGVLRTRAGTKGPAVSPAAPGNGTTLRSLYYPPVDRGRSKRDQLRCGEHSDYGSITLLFQGSEGLQVSSPLWTRRRPAPALTSTPAQVRTRSGDYVDIPLVPGAVLVNVGDLMQRWTDDGFVSSVGVASLTCRLPTPSPEITSPHSRTGCCCPLLETPARASLWPSSCTRTTTPSSPAAAAPANTPPSRPATT